MTLLAAPQQAAFISGAGHVKAAKRNRYGMVGELYLSKTGYLLLSVPNSFVRGAFSALNEPGAELPSSPAGRLEAHVTVMRPEEIEQLGGADKIDERGRDFNYSLGRIKEITPHGWPEMSKCWIIQVHSPELRKLRKTYGLTPLPEHPFHCTIAVRRKGVLYENETSKTADGNSRESRDGGFSGIPELARNEGAVQQPDDSTGVATKTAYNPEPARDWVVGIASGDARAFVEYMICHNKEDRDSGELDDISNKELRRLQREWTSLDSKKKLQYHRKTAVWGDYRGQDNIGDSNECTKDAPGHSRLDEAADARGHGGTYEEVRQQGGSATASNEVHSKGASSAHRRGIGPTDPGYATEGTPGANFTSEDSPGATTFETRGGHKRSGIRDVASDTEISRSTKIGERSAQKVAGKAKDPSYDPEHPEECCPHCGARLERGDDGDCNRCGKLWPKEAANSSEKLSPVLRIERKTGGRGLVMTPPAKKAGVKEDLAAAAKETDTDPTEAQIEAGNYKKGKISLHGLEISIENPKGSTRSGTNPDGTTWSTKMKAHYGYIKRTEGADGDHVDVFIGPDPESELVAVINQQDPGTKKFDECKCILGSTSDAEARELYLANYEDGWEGLQSCTLVTMPQFKWWLEHGDTIKPVKDSMFVKERRKAASVVFTDDDDFWNSPPNKEGRKCPGCGKLFKECEPLPGVEMCETCERFGPTKKAAEHVPTVGVDFDGTIAKLVEPFEPDVAKLVPRPNARKWMKRFQDMGVRVIVFTTRGDGQAIKDWCHEHDIPIDYVNENPDQPPDTSGKIIADVYWDDRSVDASGALDNSGPEVEKRLSKVGQMEPIYRRALRTQLHSPKWNPNQSIPGNVFANLREVRERGLRIIEQGDAMDRLRAGSDPGFAHQQFRAVLSGRYQPKVSDPIDQFVFQRTM